MINSCFLADRHGNFSDPVEDYCGKEGANWRTKHVKAYGGRIVARIKK